MALNFAHFVAEYKKMSMLFGIPFDLDRAELYYEDLEDFSDEMLSACFKEARRSFRKMPLPVDFKEIRSIISQQHFERQPKLAAVPEVYGPMPDHIRELMKELSNNLSQRTKAPKASQRPKGLSLTIEETRQLERELSYGEGEDF